MARRKFRGRQVNGVLLYDKPAGVTSNAALQTVKKLYGAAKAGHTGSLDPLATGMLPICFGEATKISAFLLDADKRYHVTCQLGQQTDTGDADGQVLQTVEYSSITLEAIQKASKSFIGEVEQVPPMYSALKHEGERLYKLAREGKQVERKARLIEIYDLEVLGYDQLAGLLSLEIHCSKGTYVRTLIEDLAIKLGNLAHVTQLRRLSVGPYDGDMITLEQLQDRATQGKEVLDSMLLPVDSGVLDWPDIRLDADAAHYVAQGQAVMVPHAPTEGWVRLYNQTQFMGVGEIQDDGRVAPRRMLQNSVSH